MANECYELIISGKIAGQFVQTVLHLNLDNTASTDPFVMATAILAKMNTSANFSAKWLDCLPEDYTMTSQRVRRVLPTGGPTQIYLQSNLYGTAGTRSGTVDVTTSCPLIIWLTTLRPSKTGRTFLPGVSENDVDEGVLEPSLLTAIQSLGTLMKDGFTPASPAYLVSGAILRRSIPASDDISNFRTSPVIGNQRRRTHPI